MVLVTLYLVEDRGTILLLLINAGLSVLVDFGRGRAFLVSLCVKLSSRRSSASSNKHFPVTRTSDHWAAHAHKMCPLPHWEQLGGFDVQIASISETALVMDELAVSCLVRLNTLQVHTGSKTLFSFSKVVYFHCGTKEVVETLLNDSLFGLCLTS